MADYYVTLKSGTVLHFSGVTATPTLVLNDGVAATISTGVYRDYVGAVPSTATTMNAWGPDYVHDMTYSGSPPALSALTQVLGDNAAHVAPRFLEREESHWEFVCGSFSYFVPWAEFESMSPTNPSLL